MFVIISNDGMIDKGVCDKGFIWNPSNCECECDKSCDIGEYFDYENYKCRKKLIDKLVEKCTENVKETRLVENKYENICSFCIVYIVLFSLNFAINIGIGIYFVYYKYMSRNKENVFKYDYNY